jgi:chemotaxis protein MotB
MTANEKRPLIVKRKKVIAGGGHHGGAWKVAYADFVTAMMAFFMLMWLLNATTEQQRKGLADYFAPTIPVNRISGGGDGALTGDVVTASTHGAQDGTGGDPGQAMSLDLGADRAALPEAQAAEVAALRALEEQLIGTGGESLVSEEALKHVVTRLTDEGLVIEIFSRPGAAIFLGDTDALQPVALEILSAVARVSMTVTNQVAIGAHLRTRPIVLADHAVWELSTARAAAAREVFEAEDFPDERIERQVGHADRSPVTAESTDLRNERIEVTLLRRQR